MKPHGLSLARIDAIISQAKARAALYRGKSRASRQKDPPSPPRDPAPPPPSPTPPSFPRDLTADTARFIVAAGRRRRAEKDPSNDEQSDPNKRDDEPGSPPEPEPGSLILDAIRRRGK